MKKLIVYIGICFISIGINISSTAATSLTANSLSIANSLNQFAFDIYKRTNISEQNSVISPYSVSSLLGILTTASAGNTREQFIRLLHLNNVPVDELDQTLNQLNVDLYQNNKDSLQIANAFWADKKFTFKTTFLNSLNKLNFINFKIVNFKDNPEQARETINTFISDHTNGYIKTLFDQGTITPDDLLVLTNAIYFKGLWNNPFDAKLTLPRPFHLNQQTKIDVPMMFRKGDYLYFENDALQMLALPYSNSTLVMYVLLPKDKHDLKEIEKNVLNITKLQQMQSQFMMEQDMMVYLPKFKIESSFTELETTVKQMGLTDAFDLVKANFSNLTDSKFAISKIIQKAIIQVDEKGTTAAAASGIMGIGSIGPAKKIAVFNADHPFIFILQDSKSPHIILFIGQVVNPLK